MNVDASPQRPSLHEGYDLAGDLFACILLDRETPTKWIYGSSHLGPHLTPLSPVVAFVGWNATNTLNLTGSAVIVLFGLLVGTVPPRARVQQGFALFAVSWGAATATVNIATMTPTGHPWLIAIPWLAGVYTLGGIGGMLVLWWHMPVRLERMDWRLLVPALGIVALFTLSTIYSLTRLSDFDGAIANSAPLAVSTGFVWAPWSALLVILVIRYLRSSGPPELHRQIPIVSAGLIVYLAVNARWALTMHPTPMRVQGTVVLLFLLLFAVLWLVASAMGPHPRAARNVAWIALGGGVLGLVHDVDLLKAGALGIDGLARLASVAFLAVAILRFKAFGIHPQLRFGISKSTMAGAFIATFFVASEIAQELFAEVAQSQVIGILAAGLLVFVIAPLQRFADHLADRAVPAEGSPDSNRGREASFRNAVRWALADGRMDETDERRLLTLAEDLGISVRRAFALREDVQARLESRRGD